MQVISRRPRGKLLIYTAASKDSALKTPVASQQHEKLSSLNDSTETSPSRRQCIQVHDLSREAQLEHSSFDTDPRNCRALLDSIRSTNRHGSRELC